jgi:16S rRNA (adenine1518-N6/adenine1519-N6)-dimethyltransferase
MRRKGPAGPPDVRRLVRAAFAHRRKALARSLELSLARSGADGERPAREAESSVRAAARDALEALGHPPDERAERLAPGEFVELAARLERWLSA